MNPQIPSLRDFGAVGDGATDDTAAIQAALDSGTARVYVADGVYLTGALSIPRSVKFIEGPGTLRATGTLASFAGWLVAQNSDRLTVRDVTLDLGVTAYPSNGCLAFVRGQNLLVENVAFPDAGRFGVQLINSSTVAVRGCTITNYAQSAVDSTGCGGVSIVANTITNTSRTSQHNINIGYVSDLASGGSDNEVIGNRVRGGPGFSIHFHHVTRGRIVANTLRDTAIEAIVVGGATTDILIADNECSWLPGVSTDYGMSYGGDDAAHVASHVTIARNTIHGCAKSGIAVGQFSRYFIVENNRIVDANQSNGAVNGNGIELIGTGTIGTVVRDNVVVNADGGHVQFAVQEYPGPDYTMVEGGYAVRPVIGTTALSGAHSAVIRPIVSLPAQGVG